jgi:erythronate-4-phosphate dehydrogenase
MRSAMVKKILWQQGIPTDFFTPEFTQVIFQNTSQAISQTFKLNPDAEAIFFRANFRFLPEYFEKLPSLKFAVLVSTGTDNVPVHEFQSRGIQFCSAEGANSRAVVEYVIQALFLLWEKHPDFMAQGVGIVGRGRIGGLLERWLLVNNLPVRWHDPFLPGSFSLQDTLQMPVVSFHVPLTRTGAHKTQHMLNQEYFGDNRPYVIQASRGEIWETDFYSSGAVPVWAQDVYPVEPPRPDWLPCANYNTPHIAGYSTRGRLGGITKGLKIVFPDKKIPDYPMGQAWYLENEHKEFLHNYAGHSGGISTSPAGEDSYFNLRRDNFPYRKEFSEYTAEERDQFRARFSKIPDKLIMSLWRKHEF